MDTGSEEGPLIPWKRKRLFMKMNCREAGQWYRNATAFTE